MGRIIDPNDHNKINQPRQITTQRKPTWLGDVGDPCGYCCLTLWWISDTDYSKKPCPIILPNDKEYIKFCIDHTKSILYGINTVDDFSAISQWRGFSYFRAAAKQLGFKSDGIPLKSFKPGDIPQGTKNLSGLALCENYYETLRILANTNSPYKGKFGVDNYEWSPNGYCGSEGCSCAYPCANAHITKKVWDGTSTGDCVCADPLVEIDGECFCEDSDGEYSGNMSKKRSIVIKARDARFYSVRPVGRCECKKETIGSKKTRLISIPTQDSDCPDCECEKAEVYSEGQTYTGVNSVWVRDTSDPPGSCRCDESLGLTNLSDNPDRLKDLVCMCANVGHVWDEVEGRCVPGRGFFSWGSVEIEQNFTDANDPFNDDKQCPEPGDYVTYLIKFTIDDLRNFDGADVIINTQLSDNLIIERWDARGLESPDIVLDPENFDGPNSSQQSVFPDITYPPDPIPTKIRIGKHYATNYFSPGPKKDYYDKYINKKHFAFVSDITYRIELSIVAKIDLSWIEKGTFGISATLSSVRPYLFNDNRPKYLPSDYRNIGIGRSTASLTGEYDPDSDCENSTESPTESETASG